MVTLPTVNKTEGSFCDINVICIWLYILVFKEIMPLVKRESLTLLEHLIVHAICVSLIFNFLCSVFAFLLSLLLLALSLFFSLGHGSMSFFDLWFLNTHIFCIVIPPPQVHSLNLSVILYGSANQRPQVVYFTKWE